ncbi:MAG: hypothetical protein GC204_09425 [Chloroflexi bacterium]|nr:hypothetical protein [Chloroflexota bacterium]
MIKTNDTLDPQTRHEVLTAVLAMSEAFEAAAKEVDKRFPEIDPEIRVELIREAGKEIIANAAVALDDDYSDSISEKLVADMLRTACAPC